MNTFLGLPIHPFIVHMAVVLVPLAAVMVLIALPWRRARFALSAVAAPLALIGAVATYIAKESGEQLARVVGEPESHAQWGTPATVSAFAFAGLAVVWLVVLLMQRRRARDGAVAASGAPTLIVGLLTAAAAVVATTFIVLAGHSGAEAVWSDQVSAAAVMSVVGH
ncbi:MAG: hypothetical protein Q4G34_07550 [Micrococcus sp.]|nr:hypothetical protein [Micrococcus sp.]